ncbi:uncharacterized protein [Rutidosis leptorrhynchoides]|uniref:uncharacterized protein n=1 Tax=Rutidosis leptorrhynchoides TaxID=125765 RepID=UPI003A99AB43
MAKGKLILICRSGGEFVTNDDGTMTYNGGEANAANVTSETPFNELKINLAETCNLNQETVSVKYFLPGNKRNLITVKNDKDVKRMVDFHGEALTAEVFVAGTLGFIRKSVDVETNRLTDTKNNETVNIEDEGSKKEKAPRGKAGAKKDKKVKKDDKKVAKSPITSPVRMTRRSAAAAAKAEAQKEKNVSSDTSSNAASEQVNQNVDSGHSSDYVPIGRYTKRKKGADQNETDVNASPADSVKKRRRTPSWKVGANGRPTIVSDSAGSKTRGTKNEKSQRKRGRTTVKEEVSQETKSGRKRGRPRANTIDREPVEFVGPSALATCDDDASPETIVTVWKSAITNVGQEFANVDEFKEALHRFALANDFELKFKKNDTNRVVCGCASEGCSWKINGVWVPSKKSFKIKTLNNVHTCDNDSKNWLVNTINEKLQETPHLKPNEIANALVKDVGVRSNTTQVFQETGANREQLHGSDTDAYNKLPWFCDKIIETNPGSVCNLVISENKRFKALFVSFYSSLCGFQNGCRPLLFLEATSLRSEYGESILTAYAIDGNDGFFPVAFAIVDVEDDNNWHWFLEQLKVSILNSQSITFVYDREKNLKNSIFEVFQDSHVGYSIYHLLESFKRNVKGPFQGDGKSYLPVHFLAAAHAVRLVGFKKSTEQIKHISAQAYDWVMQIEPEHWTNSSFKGERYNHITDDVGWPLAKLMEDYRALPILHKIDAIIRTMIDAISDAKLDACMWSTHLTPSKERELQEENMRSCGLKVLISSDTLFEVREDSTHVVNISTWSCTCFGWKETGLPCRHALAVFALIGRNPYEFCSSYFTVDAYRLTYIDDIAPVPIEKEAGEKMEAGIAGCEIDDAFIVEGWNDEGGEKIEIEIAGGEIEEALKVGGGNDEGGENMEVETTGGEIDEALIVGGGNDEGGENIEVEITGGEIDETLIVGGGNEEGGEKVGVEEENSKKLEMSFTGYEHETDVEKEKSETVEVVDDKGEDIEIEKVGDENEDVGKVQGEILEVEKVEGQNGEIRKTEDNNDESDVLVLPPIPVKPADVAKEKMEWDEAEVETKRTVTCTKCKQPGHNKKSCNFYQAAAQQEAC